MASRNAGTTGAATPIEALPETPLRVPSIVLDPPAERIIVDRDTVIILRRGLPPLIVEPHRHRKADVDTARAEVAERKSQTVWASASTGVRAKVKRDKSREAK